jgi:hypothetical protein
MRLKTMWKNIVEHLKAEAEWHAKTEKRDVHAFEQDRP